MLLSSRTTARGHRFEGNRVGNLRRHWNIPCFEAGPPSTEGKLASIKKAAVVLGVAPSTLHRIRLTDDLIARFSETAGEGFVTMHEATRKLGVSRQTVLQRVKRGELEVAHVTKGRKKGIRIKMITRQSELFDRTS
jgi:hypothetical protein